MKKNMLKFYHIEKLKKFVKIMRMYEKKYNKNDKDC